MFMLLDLKSQVRYVSLLVFGYVRKRLSTVLTQNWSLRWAKNQESPQKQF